MNVGGGELEVLKMKGMCIKGKPLSFVPNMRVSYKIFVVQGGPEILYENNTITFPSNPPLPP